MLSLNGFRNVFESSLIVYQTANYHPDRILPFHDLVFMTDGYFDIFQEGKRALAKAGDLLFLHANSRHYPAEISPAATQCYYIHFSCDVSDTTSIKIPNEVAEHEVCIPMHLRVQDSERLLKLFKTISSTYYSENDYRNKLNHTYLQQLLTEIHIQANYKVTPHDDLITKYIIETINSNLQYNLTIEDLSKKLGYAPRTLHLHFKKTMGLTIHQYQLKLKLDIIKSIIQDSPDITLREIALSYGFYDEYHLSKCFKSNLSLSPLQFRSQINTKTIIV